jgi:hypothetical protein
LMRSSGTRKKPEGYQKQALATEVAEHTEKIEQAFMQFSVTSVSSVAKSC